MEKKLKVKALRLGYHDYRRRRAGDVFEMTESEYFRKVRAADPETGELKETGKLEPCSWVQLLEKPTVAGKHDEKPSGKHRGKGKHDHAEEAAVQLPEGNEAN